MLRYNKTSNVEEDIMEDRDKKVAAAALLILAGGIIGAGVALLFAPQSGQRTRKDIVRYAKKTKNRADEAVDDLSASVSDLVDAIGDKTDDLLEKGKVVAGSARKDLIRLIEEGASRLEQFRTKLSRM
jgi:gas vesicle protein